jgi:hypothetical protein
MLVEEIEPDYKRVHVRCGLGFQSCQLCKAEKDAKALAHALDHNVASQMVSKAEDNKVCIIYTHILPLLTYKSFVD